jgi:hypothetical protein
MPSRAIGIAPARPFRWRTARAENMRRLPNGASLGANLLNALGQTTSGKSASRRKWASVTEPQHVVMGHEQTSFDASFVSRLTGICSARRASYDPPVRFSMAVGARAFVPSGTRWAGGRRTRRVDLDG